MAENIEYLWVEKNLPGKPCRLFNFGSNADRTVELFAEGYTVVGVDLLPDPRAGKTRNYEFHKGNFFEMSFKERFECVYGISSVEHVGLQCYGVEAKFVDPDGDIKIVKKLYELLKPKGVMLLTVPYGEFPRGEDWRVYGKDRLTKLVGDFKYSLEFFVAAGEYFLQEWRQKHGPFVQPPIQLLYNIRDERVLTQGEAEKVFSVVCIKIEKGVSVKVFENPKYWCGQRGYRAGTDGIGYQDFPIHQVKVAHILAKQPRGKVLDVGCAFGYIVKRLCDKGIDAFGIDISQYALSQAPGDVKPYLKQGSADNLPWPNEHFDMVVTFATLEHLDSETLSKAISEIKRVAKRGIIAVTPGDDPDFDNDITHQTKQPLSWWRAQFPPEFEVRSDANEEWLRAKIPEVYVHRIQWLQNKVTLQDKILDVGCAENPVWADTPYKVTTLDKSVRPEEQCFPDVVGEAENLPFEDGHFDIVAEGELLEHVPNPQRVLSEATRVAKKKVIITVPWEHQWPPELKPFQNPGHVRFYSKETFEDELKQLELPFNIEEIRHGPWVWLGAEIYCSSRLRTPKKANKGGIMKILVICTTVYDLPPKGYSGLEWLVSEWAKCFRDAGHQVSVVCSGGSNLGEGIEIISTGLREPEEAAYLKYKNRLESGEFDAVFDNSWGWFSVLSQMEADHQLPIIHIYHSDAANLRTPPPVQHPCLVALSKSQAELIGQKWNVVCRVNYNGIDLSFYKADPKVKRGHRYLFMGRYTPEKAPLEAIFLAKKCRVPLDLYGDVEIIASQDYLAKVVNECDNRQIVFHPGVSREETVKLYQNHKALIHLVNYNEAFGLVPVECMACGTPVIVNRRGALPELVKPGKSGFVVDSLEEAEDLIKSDAVSKLKAEDIVKQGEKFSIEKSAKGYLRLLSDIASGTYW